MYTDKNADPGTRTASIWPGLICLCICIGILFPGAIFKGKAILPGNLLYAYHPWQSEFPDQSIQPVNWILFDEILEFIPWRETIRKNVLSGRIPLWDPTAFCGFPFAGIYQNALIYPPDRLLDFLPVSTYTLIRNVFHILLAGAGMGFYLKRYRMKQCAVTFGTLAFGISGFMIVWLGHPHAKVAAWLPMLFLGMDHILSKSPKAVPIAGLAMTMTLIAGHIETALHTISAALLYLILSLFIDKESRHHIFFKTLIVLFVSVISLCIAGSMIIPFSEYLTRSVAFATRSSGVITQGWLDPILAITLLMPRVFGSSADFNYWYPGFNSSEIGGGYVGVITVLLAITAVFALWRKPFVIKHGLLVLLSGLISFGIPPFYSLISKLPGFKMSYNFRLVIILGFSSIALASYMIDRMIESIRPIMRYASSVTAILLSALCFASIPILLRHTDQIPVTRPSVSAIATTIILIFGALTVLLSGKHLSATPQIFLMLLVIIDLLYFGYGFNPVTASNFPEHWPLSKPFVQVHSDPFRVLPIGKTYPPHICAMMNMHDIRGNDALTPQITDDFIACIEPDVRSPFTLPALRLMYLNNWTSPLLNALNVRYILFPATETQSIPEGLQPVRTSGGVHIFRNPNCMPRAFCVSHWKVVAEDQAVLEALRSPDVDLTVTAYLTDCESVPSSSSGGSQTAAAVTGYDNHEVNVATSTDSNSLLVLADTFFPGWQATVDEKPVECLRVNHMMRGVFLDSGNHTVRFKYCPVSWRLGLFFTLIGCMLFVTFSFLLGYVFSDKRNRGTSSSG
ncbi:YfhO family protein [bacterium]|nr:YfhO family protein [candidate division CSSED10-310 bacterium]